jgi:phosphotriesterase-related protein
MPCIVTVRGELSPDRLGNTLPHEHIFGEYSEEVASFRLMEEKYRDKILWNAPVSMDILADLKRSSVQCKDNWILTSFDDAKNELMRFKQFGGDSIVDCSAPQTEEGVKALLKISEATGLNVICGTGWYIEATHPSFVRQNPVSELTEYMVKELNEGIDGTSIRAGVIGEIGCSGPLTINEEKVLAACAKAQARTHAPLTVHPGNYDYKDRRVIRQVRRELDILQRNDADMSKVYVSHMDDFYDDVGYNERIMEQYGVTLSYDTFGMEYYFDHLIFGYCITDKERIATFVELLRKGFEEQLMMSHDISEKIALRKYGGWGYSHILEHIVPTLKQNGVPERQINTMLVDNPRRLFSR